MDRTRFLLAPQVEWSGESPNNQTIAARRTMIGSLLDEALGSELTPNALEDDGGRVGSELRVATTCGSSSTPIHA